MADTFKVLGQLQPGSASVNPTPEGATVENIIYTVPDGAQTTVSSIVACHAGTGSHAYYIAIRPSRAPRELKHYIAYGKSLSSAENAIVVAGITLNDGDSIEVQTNGPDVVFSVFGVETV
jgi:hypothetical protein